MKSQKRKPNNIIYLKTNKKLRPTRVGNKFYYLILACAATLLVIGMIMILSSSSILAYNRHNDIFYYLKRQIVYAIIGVIGMIVLSRVDYHKLKNWALFLLGGTIFLLTIVFIPGVGKLAGGATRWIVIGSGTLQPSEIAKFTLIVYIAAVVSRRKFNINDLNQIAVHFVVILVIVGLVFFQPDLGTAFITGLVILVMLFIAGVDIKVLFTTVLFGVMAIVIGIMSEEYRRQRFLSFINPWKDPQESGFHIIQSWLALGTGGLTGVGLGMSKQKFLYLPAAHTDFIFAIIGEEAGLVGSLVVITLFFLLIYFGFIVTFRANDMFGQILAGGITSLIAFETLINIGGVVGILPITGIPLPLISFGGTSLLMTLIEIGVLLNISLSMKEKRRVKIVNKDYDKRRRNSRSRSSRHIVSRRTSIGR